MFFRDRILCLRPHACARACVCMCVCVSWVSRVCMSSVCGPVLLRVFHHAHKALRDLTLSVCVCHHTQVLRINPDSSKAYYRRGVARHALQQTEGALADLTKAADM